MTDTYVDAAGRPLQQWYKLADDWYLGSQLAYGVSGDALGKPVTATRYNMVAAAPQAPTPGVCLEPEAIRVRHSFSYDGPAGMVSSKQTEVAFGADGSGGSATFFTDYGYDRWANLATIGYPALASGVGCTEAPAVTFTYDAAGLLGITESRFGDTRDVLSSPSFDADTGMMTSWETAAGYAYGDLPLTTVRHSVTPDGTRARIKRIRATNPEDTFTYFDTGEYTYDGAGNITELAGSTQTAAWSYTYDALNRLRQAASGTGQSYAYDDLGNLTSLGGTAIPVDAATNRLQGGHAYDARGNLVQEPMGHPTIPWIFYEELVVIGADPLRLASECMQDRSYFFSASNSAADRWLREWTMLRAQQGKFVPNVGAMNKVGSTRALVTTIADGLTPSEEFQDCMWNCLGEDPFLPYIAPFSLAPVVNLKTPAEMLGNGMFAGSKRSMWTTVDRRLPAWMKPKVSSGATVTRGTLKATKYLGRYGTATLAIGVGALSYSTTAAARCQVLCWKKL